MLCRQTVARDVAINNIVIGAKNAQLKTLCVAVGSREILEMFAIAMVKRENQRMGVGELERNPPRRRRQSPRRRPVTAPRRAASAYRWRRTLISDCLG